MAEQSHYNSDDDYNNSTDDDYEDFYEPIDDYDDTCIKDLFSIRELTEYLKYLKSLAEKEGKKIHFKDNYYKCEWYESRTETCYYLTQEIAHYSQELGIYKDDCWCSLESRNKLYSAYLALKYNRNLLMSCGCYYRPEYIYPEHRDEDGEELQLPCQSKCHICICDVHYAKCLAHKHNCGCDRYVSEKRKCKVNVHKCICNIHDGIFPECLAEKHVIECSYTFHFNTGLHNGNLKPHIKALCTRGEKCYQHNPQKKQLLDSYNLQCQGERNFTLYLYCIKKQFDSYYLPTELWILIFENYIISIKLQLKRERVEKAKLERWVWKKTCLV